MIRMLPDTEVVTIPRLAQIKKLPVELFHTEGFEDTPEGIYIPCDNPDGSLCARYQIRKAIRARDGTFWDQGVGEIGLQGRRHRHKARCDRYVVFCEGTTDYLTFRQHDFPVLGFPGCSMGGKLVAEDTEEIDEIFVCHDGDEGGDIFERGIIDRARQLRFTGRIYTICFQKIFGVKDASDLHVRNWQSFPTLFQDAMEKVRADGPVYVGEVSRSVESRARETPAKVAVRVVNVCQLLRHQFQPQEPIVSPILHKQSLGMVHSIRGVGKTYLALGLGYALASGTPFLRWQVPKPRPVLFLDGEMPGVVMQERLGHLLQAVQAEPPDPNYFRIVTPDLQDGPSLNLAIRAAQAAIEDYLDGVALLIIDNLSTLYRHGEENAAESWEPIQEFILRLRRNGMAVLLIHHSGKAGTQRGTSRREDILDTVLKLNRPTDYHPSEGCRFEVHFEKARGFYGPDCSPFEARLESDGKALLWSYRDLEDTLVERVARLASEDLSQREIARELSIPRSTVNRHLKRARALGLVNDS